MIYLASPYYHQDPLVMKTRFLLAMQATKILLEREAWVYSPIVHNHPLELDRPHEFWMRYDLDMLRRCDSLMVLAIPGWRESKGVTIEIDIATRLGMSINHINEEGNLVWPA